MNQIIDGTKHQHVFEVRAFDKDGNLLWEDTAYNLVTNAGLDDILDKYYKGSSYTAGHYVGLTDGTPTPAAGDTLASHAGWAEVTAYTGSRPAFTPGAVSGQSVDNSLSKASFSIDASATIGGAFLATTTDNTGVLVGVAAFTGGDKLLGAGDTLEVTVTANASSV